ncbi:MAG TPA: cupin domain-containing protein [Solirubrobacteraceae bacterium]|nr:cupin domain-containing protein [Solirubrobacteraceae bacterium]
MSYTLKNLEEVHDIAAERGLSDVFEARFARKDLEAEDTGLTLHRVKPNKRQAFGHRHEHAEEVYVVLSGSGRVRLDDEIVELKRMDALRVAPRVARRFEAGPDGLEMLAVGPHHDKDGEILPDFWKD